MLHLRNRFFLLVIFVFSSTVFLAPSWVSAQTLKSLAIRSSALLAIADNTDLQKKCRIESSDISMLSQQLKIQVDQKIDQLDEEDLKIIEGRSKICRTDCTCAIYSYALEQRGLKNVKLERLAATETAADRRRCLVTIKNYCQLLKEISSK